MPVSPVVTPSPGQGEHGYVTIVDQQGYVIGSVASTDGALYGTISGESVFLYTSGGPLLTDGTPSQLAFDRIRSLQGKGNETATITTTLVGDTTLACSGASDMKSVMPGMAIKLANPLEYVYVDTDYIPSASSVSVPLQSPVVRGGQTQASWEIFTPNGPGTTLVSPAGVLPSAPLLYDAAGTGYYLLRAATSDVLSPPGIQAVAAVGFNGSTSERIRSPNVFKPFNAQAVTASSANTPTSIWTPASGKKFRLMGYWFSTTVAAGLVFHDLAAQGGTGLLGIPSPIHPAAGVIQSPAHIENGILSAVANNQLWIDATAATTLTGFVLGTEE